MAKKFNTEDKAISQLMDTKTTDRLYRRMDPHQKEYRHSIEEYKMVFVDEKAGTGKTEIAVHAALDALRQGIAKKILYIRFPSKRGQKLGALPGDLKEKERIYMYPFIEALNECGLQDEAIEMLEAQGIIEMSTDVTLRGRTLKGSFVIVDETQNAEDLEQLQLTLTRVKDDGAGCVVIGHSEQLDSHVKKYGKYNMNAFEVYQIHMTKKNWAKKCRLYNNYRGVISQWADEVMKTLEELV